MAEPPDAPLLFAGPTTYGLDVGVLQPAGVRLLPPVRRGDVQRQVEAAAFPGVLLICDGVFQSVPAVSHSELCAALDAGWQVWGVSSLGAIRAYELRGHGMRGFGEVFAMFSRFEDFTDDELCLLHFPEAPWFPVSEALVNVRHALDRHGPALGIGEAAARRVVDGLRSLWFGDRTPQRIRSTMIDTAGCSPAQADALLSALSAQRLKTLDLEQLLRRRPWLEAGARTP